MLKVGRIMRLLLLGTILFFTITACGGELNEQEDSLEEEDAGVEDSQEDENNDEVDASEEETGEKEHGDEEQIGEEENMDSNEIQGEYFTKDVEVDDSLSNWIESKKYEPGVYQYPDDEKIYIIAAGERNTGGYSVVITEEILKGVDLNLYYKILTPGPNDMVTQAITYPYLLIKISGGIEEVDFIKQ
jgi:hypothetical protein